MSLEAQGRFCYYWRSSDVRNRYFTTRVESDAFENGAQLLLPIYRSKASLKRWSHGDRSDS